MECFHVCMYYVMLKSLYKTIFSNIYHFHVVKAFKTGTLALNIDFWVQAQIRDSDQDSRFCPLTSIPGQSHVSFRPRLHPV